MTTTELQERTTIDPAIFGGKPIVRGRRLAGGYERIEPFILGKKSA
ncbi:MAG: hypothetical protein ABIO70_24980 [Pseudomonadota bacterium]